MHSEESLSYIAAFFFLILHIPVKMLIQCI